MGATEKVFADPRHRYTRLLLGSVPRLGSRWRDERDAGPAPETVGRIDGAAALVEVDEGHFVSMTSGEEMG